MKVIIIDDELLARTTLKKFIENLFQEIEIVALAANAQEGYALIHQYQPDFIFLDIEMPGGNGFDMLSMFEQINFQIIFTTAYDHYAIKAIKFSALDYILKPIDAEELSLAVQKAIANKHQQDQVRIPHLLTTVKEKRKQERITLADRGSFVSVDLADVILLKASSNYTQFIFKDRSPILISKTIKEYEELLPSDQFIRIHKSSIVNLAHVERYFKGDGGQVRMSNGELVKVSRQRKNDFLSIYK